MTARTIEELPVELLGRIFEFAVELGRVHPEVLLQVSRKWYQTTMSWRCLWSCISIVGHSYLDIYDVIDDLEWRIQDHYPPSVRKVQAYLERSGDCPLSIVLSRSLTKEPVGPFEECISILRGEEDCHLPRWKSLYLRISEIEATLNLPSYFPLNLPNLVHVQFREKVYHRSWGDFFTSTPKLEHLSVDQSCRFRIPNRLLRQTTLTTMTIGDSHVEIVGRTLQTWDPQHLRHLILPQVHDQLYVRVSPIHLPNLVSLHIHNTSWITVLNALQIPSIKTLTITVYLVTRPPLRRQVDHQKTIAELLKTLIPILPRIEDLTMTDVVPVGKPMRLWRSVFAACHSLQQLTLHRCDVAESVLGANPELCPRLISKAVSSSKGA